MENDQTSGNPDGADRPAALPQPEPVAMVPPDGILLVLTTVGSRDEADEIAQALVDSCQPAPSKRCRCTTVRETGSNTNHVASAAIPCTRPSGATSTLTTLLAPGAGTVRKATFRVDQSTMPSSARRRDTKPACSAEKPSRRLISSRVGGTP